MMIRTAAALAIAILSCAPAFAAERVALKTFVDNPQPYMKKLIRLGPINCVNDPSGFACIGIIDGRALKIDAVGLGIKTPQAIAEKLIGGCKGSANLERNACRFMADFVPQSFRKMMLETDAGSRPAIAVFAQDIDFFPPK